MPADSKSVGLSVRLPSELKNVIEQAAASLGLSVNDFAVAALVQAARSALHQQRVTELSERDRDVFVALLALIDAARKYEKLLVP
jgi:uncharacterized protein (DUF1778 family)